MSGSENRLPSLHEFDAKTRLGGQVIRRCTLRVNYHANGTVVGRAKKKINVTNVVRKNCFRSLFSYNRTMKYFNESDGRTKEN